MHPPGKYKAIGSTNEQGHTDLSEEMKGLFSSSEYATTVTSPHQSNSRLVLAHGTGSSHPGDTAKTIRLRGSLDQSNSPRRNFQQGDTSNDPNSSSMMTNNTIAEISVDAIKNSLSSLKNSAILVNWISDISKVARNLLEVLTTENVGD
jgi:hypothetical protein